MKDQDPILLPTKTMIEAYEKLLQFTMREARSIEEKTGPTLHKIIDSVSEELKEIGEITEEEIEKVVSYLKRDLDEAATTMTKYDTDFFSWLGLKAEIIEDYFLDLFKEAADQTRIELKKIQMEAESAEYKTGEITGPGVLVCDSCGEELHFEKAGHIPPCPRCKKSIFHRQMR